ncbi:hypothetical protein CEXT_671051 [Caerostris extrusa]|uniref:Uncharacterized protein n=1 Tax=Caerostris extrusa TaxID=172846 RepID=A0AAV4S640_CAEEX|nr:hypothetical protein CEXT_671051 [Caerostris extrusa]
MGNARGRPVAAFCFTTSPARVAQPSPGESSSPPLHRGLAACSGQAMAASQLWLQCWSGLRSGPESTLHCPAKLALMLRIKICSLLRAYRHVDITRSLTPLAAAHDARAVEKSMLCTALKNYGISCSAVSEEGPDDPWSG